MSGSVANGLSSGGSARQTDDEPLKGLARLLARQAAREFALHTREIRDCRPALPPPPSSSKLDD